MADNVIRYEWTDSIDVAMYAAHAGAHEVYRGQIFGASCFVLCDGTLPRWQGRQSARWRPQQLLAQHHFIPDGGVHRFGMPVVGAVRDLGRH